jgi:hypothetical protein
MDNELASNTTSSVAETTPPVAEPTSQVSETPTIMPPTDNTYDVVELHPQ